MTDYLVTVTCPLSALRTIRNALSWAQFQAEQRALIIREFEERHAEDATFPTGLNFSIDQVKHFDADAKQFGDACNVAEALYVFANPANPAEEEKVPSSVVSF